MNHKKSLFSIAKLAVAAQLMLVPFAFGAEQIQDVYPHELIGGTSGTLSFGGGNTLVGLALGYRYMIARDLGIQIGADSGINYNSKSNSTATLWDTAAVGRLNLKTDSSLMNQFFIDLGAGFRLDYSSLNDVSTTNTSFLFKGGVGKRFKLGQNFTYSPEFMLVKVEDESVSFVITPIAFSYFFG